MLESHTADALGRVCSRLDDLAGRYGDADAAASVRIDLPMTQTELAQWCGLSREAVVKALRKLRQFGWVSTTDGEVIVHDRAAVAGPWQALTIVDPGFPEAFWTEQYRRSQMSSVTRPERVVAQRSSALRRRSCGELRGTHRRGDGDSFAPGRTMSRSVMPGPVGEVERIGAPVRSAGRSRPVDEGFDATCSAGSEPVRQHGRGGHQVVDRDALGRLVGVVDEPGPKMAISRAKPEYRSALVPNGATVGGVPAHAARLRTSGESALW